MNTYINILDVIYTDSEQLDNGCLIWTGRLDNKKCPKLYWEGKQYSVHRFLWFYHFPRGVISLKEYLGRTCCNKLCNNINHLVVKPRKTIKTKEQVWNRIKKYGQLNALGCLEWQGSKGNYGISSIDGKGYTVHRISYWINSDYEAIVFKVM